MIEFAECCSEGEKGLFPSDDKIMLQLLTFGLTSRLALIWKGMLGAYHVQSLLIDFMPMGPTFAFLVQVR